MPVPPPAYLDVRGRDARLPPAAAESVGHHDRVWRVWVRVLSAPVGWSIPSLIAPKGSVGTIGGVMNFVNNLIYVVVLGRIEPIPDPS